MRALVSTRANRVNARSSEPSRRPTSVYSATAQSTSPFRSHTKADPISTSVSDRWIAAEPATAAATTIPTDSSSKTRRRRDHGVSRQVTKTKDAADSMAKTETRLAGAGTYFVRVRSINTCSVSAASNETLIIIR